MFSILKKLSEISTKKEKRDFLRNNFGRGTTVYKIVKFLIDDSITTGISKKKINKSVPIIDVDCACVFDILEYLSENSNGRDIDISVVKSFANAKLNEENTDMFYDICTKDLKLGVTKKTFNLVFPDDKVLESPYMGCVPYSKSRVEDLFRSNPYVVGQIKEDGQFLNFMYLNGKVKMTSRKGLVQHINPECVFSGEIVKRLREKGIEDFVFNGELLVEDMEDRDAANGLIRGLIASNKKIIDGDEKEGIKFEKKYGITIKEAENKLKYVVWDALNIEEFLNAESVRKYQQRYNTMKTTIEKLKNVRAVQSYVLKTEKEAMILFSSILKKGLEGLVLKSPNGEYKDGKPTWQVKMKVAFTCELVVIGLVNGKKANTIGSLLGSTSDGRLENGVSGLTDKQKVDFFGKEKELIGKIIEIKCNGVSSNASGGYGLRYAILKDFREDKSRADTLKEIIEIEEMALGLKL